MATPDASVVAPGGGNATSGGAEGGPTWAGGRPMMSDRRSAAFTITRGAPA